MTCPSPTKQLSSKRNTLDAIGKPVLKYLHLRPDEIRVLDVARQVGFGELHNIELLDCDASEERQVSPNQQKFIHLVRSDGISFISKIVVHNGEPAVIEIGGSSQGIKYTRKLKVAD